MSKEFLITGGSGFLGINLTRFLLRKGHVVRSLDIEDFEYPDVKQQVHAIIGDIRDPKAAMNATRDVDIVVHAAAALPLYSEQDILSTDIEGTRNVLDAAFRSGVDRVIHISSTAVYGIPDHHPLLEHDDLDGVGVYGRAKIMAEEVCKEYRRKGMCVTILRPKTFIGPERLGVFALLYDWAREGRSFPLIGNGSNRYQFLDVEDLCQAIYLASMGEKGRVNNTFNIGAREFDTIRNDFQAVLETGDRIWERF